jgi:F420-dependent oxidoreductase-like protein
MKGSLMRIGLQIIRFDWPEAPHNLGERLAAIARTADAAGFASLWVMDHFFQIGFSGPPEEPMVEGYTAAAHLAAHSTNARIGVLVTGVPYRHPGVLIKTATTLDVLSGGRAYLGLGAGWFAAEAHGLGVPFPALPERFERLEETLQIAHQMWRDDDTPFAGRHYQLERPLCRPQPLSRPHPPIMVGGGGERKTLRLVAQYADACNLFAGVGMERLEERAADIRHKLAVLDAHCAAIGRPPEAIERTALGTVVLGSGGQSVADIIHVCRTFRSAGIEHLIINMANVHELWPIEEFGRSIIPAVAED